MSYLNTVVPRTQEIEYPKSLDIIEGSSLASKAYQFAVNKYIDRVDPKHTKSRLLYDGEYHIPLHNFTGPGTRMDIPAVASHIPYNSIDACSKQHDIDYVEIKKDANLTKEQKSTKVMEADKKAIDCYDKHKGDYGYTAARAGIKGKLTAETLLSYIKGKPSTFYGGAMATPLYVPIVEYPESLCALSLESAGGELSEDEYQKLVAQKVLTGPDSIASKQIKKSLEKISKNYDNIIPFGSWTYRAQLYPGDIDLIEQEELSGTKEEAIKKFTKMTKEVVAKIVKSTSGEYYIGDIKAGLDSRFLFNIGELDYKTGEIKDFHPEEILKKLSELNDQKAISDEEYKSMMFHISETVKALQSVDQTSASKHYEDFYDEVREKWLLRWTSKEIKQGYKNLSGGVKYTLSEAIQDPTMTKVDMWTNIDGRFLEISNVLVYIWLKEDGTSEVLNFTNDAENLAESLKYEVEKYAYSSKFFKPTKMMKRMWSIARLKGWKEDIEKLTPILQSDLGRLSQIVSDIDVLGLLSEKGNGIPDSEIPYKEMASELSTIKYRIANVYEIISKEEEEEINEALDHMIDMLRTKKQTKENREEVYSSLKEIKEHLNELLQSSAEKTLGEAGYNPPPTKFLPNKDF